MEDHKKILDPITDVFTGSDGGVAFAILFHNLMPDFIKKAEQGNAKAKQVVEAFKTVSHICQLIQKEY